jgi:hypothetical protein
MKKLILLCMILLLGCATVPKCECKCECVRPNCEIPWGNLPMIQGPYISPPPFGSYGDSIVPNKPYSW